MSSGDDQARCRLPGDQPDPQEGVGVGQLVLADEDALRGQLGRHRTTYRGERLDHVREGIGARARRERGRATERELGIADGRVRDEVGAGDAHLADPLGIGEDGHRRHLRAGACRGGQRDDRDDRPWHAELAVVVGRLAAVREHHGHRLREVEAAASAHAHHDVRVDAGRDLGALSHLVHGDVGQHLGERRHLHARVLEQPDQVGELARGAEAGVGADEGPGPEGRGHRPQGVPLAGSEQDLLRSAQDAEHAHGGSGVDGATGSGGSETNCRGPFPIRSDWWEHGAAEHPLSTGAR